MPQRRKEWSDEILVCQQCGKPLTVQPYYSHGRLKGYRRPSVYCSPQCTGMAAHLRQLSKARGRFIDKHGYVLLTNRKGDNGYQQPEHRAVMEQMLGRKLEPHETVHHKNGIRHDNRPENLELWAGRHGRGQRVADVPLTEDIWNGMTPRWALDASV